MAPGASIIAIQVFSVNGSVIGAADTDITDALQWLYDNRATYPGLTAVNLSLGGNTIYPGNCDSEPEKPYIDQLLAVGIATVIASGNDGSRGGVTAPGCISTAVTVGAIDDSNGAVAPYANVGPQVDLLAPGTSITSSIPSNATPPTTMGIMSGTSMATPAVTGALAVLRQRYPAFTIDQLVARLVSSGPTVSVSSYVFPKIDLGRAVSQVPAAPGSVAVNPRVGAAAVSWTAPYDGGSSILTYTVTASPGGATCQTSGALTCTVNGLTPGVTYSFGATATNSIGEGPAGTASATIGSEFTPVNPTRILHTGTGIGGPAAKVGAAPRSLLVAGVKGVPANATAVIINVTAVNPTVTGSYLTVYPEGGAVPTVSSLNFVAGRTVANLVTVGLGANGRVDFVVPFGNADVIVDLVGYFAPGDAAGFSGVAPDRVLDTRNAIGAPDAPVGGPAPLALAVAGQGDVPGDADAVVMNVTVVNPTADGGYLTVFPTGQSVPNASNINFYAGDTRANLVTVKVGSGGSVSFSVPYGTSELLADVVGYYRAGSGTRFFPVTPRRFADTRRPGSGPQIGGPTPLNLGVVGRFSVPGTGPMAVSMNVTAVNGNVNGGYVTVYPEAPRPLVSSLNYTVNQIVPNQVTMKLGGSGTILLANPVGKVDLLADVVGWYG